MSDKEVPSSLFAIGINHKTAPVEIREKLYLNDEEISTLLGKARETLSECLVLSTCNRTEFYGVSSSPALDIEFYRDLLIDMKGVRGVVTADHFFTFISCAACQQLFSVATSIDSRVVGDNQILKQLRNSYFHAQKNSSVGKVLNQLLQRSFKIGKRTYTETSIHDGAVSVSLAAVETATDVFGSLKGLTAMVVGAGETARLTIEALANKRVGRILVSNRTRARAQELLASLKRELDFESEIVDFENFKSRIWDADIVITSTGSAEPILYGRDLDAAPDKVLAIDIGVPRNIDESARERPNVVLRNIDDLNAVVDRSYEKRTNDLPKVRKMIMSEMVEFLTWYYALPLMPAYEKTGAKPLPEQSREVLKIKEILNQNVSAIHKLAAGLKGDHREDLRSHHSLVEMLRQKKAEAFASST